MDAQESDSPLLDIESLTVSYGRGCVLRDISLRMHRGDVIGLVGESGCGKTTLGLAILGLLPEYAKVTGTVVFEGRDLASMPKRERRMLLGDRISTVPQASISSLDPVYRVGDLIAEVLRAHKAIGQSEAEELAVRWLRKVGIPAAEIRMRSYPHELSGGMRQRVAIALGLALNPSLLIMDEPTSALDVTIQAQILDLLKVLIREHSGSVIFITHDLGVVAQLCSRVAVMYAGQIVEESAIGTLFASAAHPYTKKLLASHPALTRRGMRLATIDGRVPDPGNLPPGCSFQPRCPIATEICTRVPPWVNVGTNHFVRCVHHDRSEYNENAS